MKVVHVSELKPGDVVTPAHNPERTSPFDASVVKSVSDTFVTLFRPYGTSTGFVYGSTPSVITLIGFEEYSIEKSAGPAHVFTVWHSTLDQKERV